MAGPCFCVIKEFSDDSPFIAKLVQRYGATVFYVGLWSTPRAPGPSDSHY